MFDGPVDHRARHEDSPADTVGPDGYGVAMAPDSARRPCNEAVVPVRQASLLQTLFLGVSTTALAFRPCTYLRIRDKAQALDVSRLGRTPFVWPAAARTLDVSPHEPLDDAPEDCLRNSQCPLDAVPASGKTDHDHPWLAREETTHCLFVHLSRSATSRTVRNTSVDCSCTLMARSNECAHVPGRRHYGRPFVSV